MQYILLHPWLAAFWLNISQICRMSHSWAVQGITKDDTANDPPCSGPQALRTLSHAAVCEMHEGVGDEAPNRYLSLSLNREIWISGRICQYDWNHQGSTRCCTALIWRPHYLVKWYGNFDIRVKMLYLLWPAQARLSPRHRPRHMRHAQTLLIRFGIIKSLCLMALAPCVLFIRSHQWDSGGTENIDRSSAWLVVVRCCFSNISIVHGSWISRGS